MHEMLPDLYLVPANNRKGFGYSQFIKHPKGNVLIPRLKATSLSNSYDWFKKMGGVDYVLISDRHFAGPGCIEVAEFFNANLFASDIESKVFRKRCPVSNKLGLEKNKLAPHIISIPTPGHTPGQLSFIVTAKRKKYMLTGDFIRWNHGKCIPGTLSKKRLSKSIRSIEKYKPNFIIGCTDYDDNCSYVEFKNPKKQVSEMLSTLTKV